MSDMDKTTTGKAQFEDVFVEEKRQNDGGLSPMPASLATLSDAEFASLGRKTTFKMDLMIMPCLVIMYIMNYLDRQNIAAAKLADIDKDLNLSDVQYQTCISLLFVGYSELEFEHAYASPIANFSTSPDAGPFQHRCWEDQISRHLHLLGYGCLGHDLGLHVRRAIIHRARARSILYWIRRGGFLSRCTILHVSVLQPEAICFSCRHTLFGLTTWQCLWRFVRHCDPETRWGPQH